MENYDEDKVTNDIYNVAKDIVVDKQEVAEELKLWRERVNKQEHGKKQS